MEIKTKHKKFKSFTDLYSFMVDGHLEEISVTMKYPDGTKSNGIMPIDMVLSFKCIEDIKSLDKELKEFCNDNDINLITLWTKYGCKEKSICNYIDRKIEEFE